jgi:hypothetical protein
MLGSAHKTILPEVHGVLHQAPSSCFSVDNIDYTFIECAEFKPFSTNGHVMCARVTSGAREDNPEFSFNITVRGFHVYRSVATTSWTVYE